MLRATKGQIDAATDWVYPAGKNSSFVHLMKEERLPHLPYERERECSFYLVSGAIEEPYGTRSRKWPQPHLRLTLNPLDGRAFFMMPRAPTMIIKWAITCLCLRSPNQFNAASYESGHTGPWDQSPVTYRSLKLTVGHLVALVVHHQWIRCSHIRLLSLLSSSSGRKE